jgi:hypothetical protein
VLRGKINGWALVLAVLALAGVLAGATPAPAEGAVCRGKAVLGDFRLEDDRRIALRRVACDRGRAVVRRFPGRCAAAYAAQGRCRIRSAGRWRCRSAMVGPLSAGAPARVRCRKGRARIAFTVAYFPPTHGVPIGRASAASGPFDEAKLCFNHSPTGAGDGQVYTVQGTDGDLPVDVVDLVKAALDAHQVGPKLNAGLGTRPRGFPRPVPILLVPGRFDRGNDLGLTAPTCAGGTVDAIGVRINHKGVSQTAAHELFHAHSFYGANGGNGPVSWFEEAAATWSESKLGFPEETRYDHNLQFPRQRLDTPPEGRTASFSYAMSRFLQFIDDRGRLSEGADWPLVRAGVSASTEATARLAAELVNRGTSLQDELAAFWGDRLKQKPAHGPQLRPTRQNSVERRIRSGNSQIRVSAKSLRTSLVNFVLAGDVERVEFEFEPPPGKEFWGLVSPGDSQSFRAESSVAFCVRGHEDELEWPGHFPVTFTNGTLEAGELEGTIKIHAEERATRPCSSNPRYMCRVLETAAEGILRGVRAKVPGSASCLFFGRDPADPGYGNYGALGVRRWRSAKLARRAVDGCIKGGTCAPVQVGGRAGIQRVSATHHDSETGEEIVDTFFVVYTATGRLTVSVFLNLTTVPETPEPEERETTIRLARAALRALR